MTSDLMRKTNSKRNIGLDLTRILAFLSVVGVHFFLNTDFYKVPLRGKRMVLMAGIRTGFMVCVPLFLLLTGYLLSAKEVPMEAASLKKYYKKIIPILLTYAFAMALVFGISSLKVDETYTFNKLIFGILGYKEYSWYVNMYVGLFLLSPFLINIWTSIGDKRTHQVLIGIFCFLTIGPTVFNVYDLSSFKAIFSAYDSNKINHLLPGWWYNIFPITYFFFGAYLREYIDFKKIRPLRAFVAFIMIVFASTIYNIWRSHGGVFQNQIWNSWGSLQNTASSVCFFILINSLAPASVDEKIERFLAYISKLTFGAYIISAVTDRIIYGFVTNNIGGAKEAIVYMPIIVLLSAIIALILAALVDFVSNKILENSFKGN